MDLSDRQKCLVLLVFVCVRCFIFFYFFFCTDKTHRMSGSRDIGGRAGGGGGGLGGLAAAPPPKFWATQIFWAEREIFGKTSF